MAKVKIPKRVAGMKIPKKVRKQAKKALKAAENPVVREFAAAAIGAATQRAARAPAGSIGIGRTVTAETVVGIDADDLAKTVRAAALDGIRRFLEGFEEGLREVSTSAAGGAAQGSRKRRGPSRPETGAAAE